MAVYFPRAGGAFLSDGVPVWGDRINSAVAMAGALDAHRDTTVRDDRDEVRLAEQKTLSSTASSTE